MKIQTVRFKNLNSLYGEWSIDFTDPHFTSSGIFAIVGTTGAGKTTVLDAISLALYGRTPRIKQVSKSTNELMSRQTGECFAEVEFQSVKGRYRVHWYQHRARKKPGGDLQAPKHEFVDADSNKVIATKLKDVAEEVAHSTGMNFDQFTRSMLLAQGDFSKFLQASSDERAPILEQITGTEIYSRISVQVHQRKTREDQKLELLEAKLKDLQLPTGEEIAAMQKQKSLLSLSISELERKINKTNKGLSWKENIQSLQKKKLEQQAAYEHLLKQWQASEDERQKLERAEKCQIIQGSHNHLNHLRTTLNGEIKRQAQTEKTILESDRKRVECGKKTTKIEGEYKALKDEHQKTTAVISSVRQLDFEIEKNGQELTKTNELVKIADSNIVKTKKDIEAINTSIYACQQLITKETSYQEKNQKLNTLAEVLSGIEEKASQYTNTCKNLEQQRLTLQTVRTSLEEVGRQEVHLNKSLSVLGEKENNLTARLKKTKDKLEELAPDGISPLYEEIQSLQTRQHRYNQIQQLLIEQQQLLEKQRLESKQQETTEKKIAALKEERKNLIALIESQKVNVKKQEEIVFLSNKIVSYEKDRARLKADTPCPLCGSKNHPYSSSIPYYPDAAEEKLQDDKEQLEELDAKRQQLDIDGNRLKTILETSLISLTEREKRLKELQQTQDTKYSFSGSDEDLAAEIIAMGKTIEEKQKILKKVEEIGGILHELEQDGSKLSQEMADQNSAVQELQQNKSKLQAELEIQDKILLQLEKESLQLFKTVAGLLKPYSNSTLNQDIDLNQHVQSLKIQLQQWQDSVQTLQKHERQLQQLKTNIEILQQSLKLYMQEQKKHSGDYEALSLDFKKYQERRLELFGTNDPSEVEKVFQNRLEKKEKSLQAEQQNLQALEKQHSALTERLQQLSHSITELTAALKKENENFSNLLQEHHFPSEESFLNSKMADEKYNLLKARLLAMEKTFSETRLKLKNSEEAIVEEVARKVTELDLETLKSTLQEQAQELSRQQQMFGALAEQLQNYEIKRKDQEQKQQQLQLQQTECTHWTKLHTLIGSADGKKFRNFAQGLTFELMVNHANQTLEKMSDRYLLRRTPKAPLELAVVDAYQAGEIRSTANLSGGETFIISLALALGLSAMASRNVQLDSLFLDEGFGTLDEESLEVALDTLSTLQQSGKIIGIISHVPLLKERIDVQLRLHAGLDGRSTISGPGTKQLPSI